MSEFAIERIQLDQAFAEYDRQFETGDDLTDDEAMEALLHLGLDFSDDRGQPLRCTKRMSRPAEMAAKGIKGKMPERRDADLAKWSDAMQQDAAKFLAKKRKPERR
jgi:hypothetical protein